MTDRRVFPSVGSFYAFRERMTVMEKMKKLLESDNGKLAAAAAGVILVLLVLWVVTPNCINIFINNGENCVNSIRKAKRADKKRRKAKKNRKNK